MFLCALVIGLARALHLQNCSGGNVFFIKSLPCPLGGLKSLVSTDAAHFSKKTNEVFGQSCQLITSTFSKKLTLKRKLLAKKNEAAKKPTDKSFLITSHGAT